MTTLTEHPRRSLLERWLVFWLCLSSLVAFFWPTLFPSALDPFTATKPTINYQIAMIMFCIGCLLPRDGLQQVLRHWPWVLAGTAIQYVTMPLLALATAKAFSLTGAAFIGVMIVGCVPGAMASNVLTLMARGNVSYSVSLTTMATLLSPLVVPGILFLILQEFCGGEMLLNAFLMLVWTVVLPVLLGHFVCRRWRRFAALMATIGPIFANAIILWLIAVVVALNRDHLGKATATLIAVLLTINVLGYLAGYFGGRALGMPEPMRRALTIEVGMQNAGLGTALALNLFKDQPATAIAPALYTFGCMLTGALLARWWARRGVGVPASAGCGA